MRIRGALLADLRAYARATATEECCGLLLARGDTICEAIPVANSAVDRASRYEIDAVAHFKAIRYARGRALDLVGAYHSHPRSRALPSPADLADAFAGFLFVIIGADDEIRAWQLEAGNFAEVVLVPVR